MYNNIVNISQPNVHLRIAKNGQSFHENPQLLIPLFTSIPRKLKVESLENSATLQLYIVAKLSNQFLIKILHFIRVHENTLEYQLDV